MHNKKIRKLVKGFKKSICQVMYDVQTVEEQRTAMRAMITTFNMIGNEKEVPMIEYAIEVINKDFPHLKEELDKLLLLI